MSDCESEIAALKRENTRLRGEVERQSGLRSKAVRDGEVLMAELQRELAKNTPLQEAVRRSALREGALLDVLLAVASDAPRVGDAAAAVANIRASASGAVKQHQRTLKADLAAVDGTRSDNPSIRKPRKPCRECGGDGWPTALDSCATCHGNRLPEATP